MPQRGLRSRRFFFFFFNSKKFLSSLWAKLVFTFLHWRRKWQPTPVFLPGESQGRESLVVCRLWGRTESDTTEATQQQHQRLSFVSHYNCRAKDTTWHIERQHRRVVKDLPGRGFLMVQRLRIHPAMEGTWVLSLVRDLRSNMPQSNKGLCTITRVYAPQ